MSFTKTYDVSMKEAFALLEKIELSVDKVSKTEVLNEAGEAGKIIVRRELPHGWRNRGVHIRETVTVDKVDEETRDVYPTKMVDGIPLGNMIQLGSVNRVEITPKKAPYLVFFWQKTGRWHKRLKVTRGIIPPNNYLGRSAVATTSLMPGIMRTVIERNLP